MRKWILPVIMPAYGLREGKIMRKTATGIVSVLMCIVMFTGCFMGKTLEERISQRDRDRFAQEMAKQEDFKDFFDRAELDVQGNQLFFRVYIGQYLDQSQEIAIKTQILNMNEDAQITQIKDKIEKAYKIRPELVTVEFYSSAGILLGKFQH